MRRVFKVIRRYSQVIHAINLGLQVHGMNDAREGEIIGCFLPVVRDELLQPDGVDLTLRVVLVQEYLDVLQTPFGFELMAPSSFGIGQDFEAGPAGIREIVLLAGVDEYLSLMDGLAGFVDDPDVDGSPGDC
jgi:hypothetical protein